MQKSSFSARNFNAFRFELGSLYQRTLNALNPDYRSRIRRLTKLKDVSLNVGSGGQGKDDWINIDIRRSHKDIYVPFDIRRKLPFYDEQVARIFAEHIIEHLDFRSELFSVLGEFRRVLKNKGYIRVIVPDTERFLRAYCSDDLEEWLKLGWDYRELPDDIYTRMHVINHIFHQEGEHYFGYDYETLKFVLERSGFTNIEKMHYMESNDKELGIDSAGHAAYSLYVEAQKISGTN